MGIVQHKQKKFELPSKAPFAVQMTKYKKSTNRRTVRMKNKLAKKQKDDVRKIKRAAKKKST